MMKAIHPLVPSVLPPTLLSSPKYITSLHLRVSQLLGKMPEWSPDKLPLNITGLRLLHLAAGLILKG